MFAENCRKTFEFQIQKIQDNIDYSNEAAEPKPECRRQETRCGIETKEACNVVQMQRKERFGLAGHLVAATEQLLHFQGAIFSTIAGRDDTTLSTFVQKKA